MKYIWIVILALLYIIWSISAIKDVIESIKEARKYNKSWYNLVDDDTIGYFVFTVSAIGITSLVMFIMEAIDHGN